MQCSTRVRYLAVTMKAHCNNCNDHLIIKSEAPWQPCQGQACRIALKSSQYLDNSIVCLVPMHNLINVHYSAYMNAVWGDLPALEMGHLNSGPVLYGDVTASCQLCIQCGGWGRHKERNAAPVTALKLSSQRAVWLAAQRCYPDSPAAITLQRYMLRIGSSSSSSNSLHLKSNQLVEHRAHAQLVTQKLRQQLVCNDCCTGTRSDLSTMLQKAVVT